MQQSKPKIIVILGPTASGKSDAAIALAKKFNGEIISADSRQVYKGLDIGSGKVSKDESRIKNQESSKASYFSEGICHHLIDVAEPMEDFNVSHFQKQAEETIAKILAQNKLPIICGGTGFWIDALVNDISLPNVKPDEKLRAELSLQSATKLFAKLQKLDPERAQNIDPKNKVRLIRAIEIATALGKVPSRSTVNGHQSSKYDCLQLGLDVPRETLNAKIKKRLQVRFDEGMTTEVENLHKNGVSWEWLEKIGLEYRWIARFLQAKISQKEMQEKLYFDSIHYAKRQMTWLKKNQHILWLKDYPSVEKEVQKFLQKEKIG